MTHKQRKLQALEPNRFIRSSTGVTFIKRGSHFLQAFGVPNLVEIPAAILIERFVPSTPPIYAIRVKEIDSSTFVPSEDKVY
jgi:hypothetical protein